MILSQFPAVTSSNLVFGSVKEDWPRSCINIIVTFLTVWKSEMSNLLLTGVSRRRRRSSGSSSSKRCDDEQLRCRLTLLRWQHYSVQRRTWRCQKRWLGNFTMRIESGRHQSVDMILRLVVIVSTLCRISGNNMSPLHNTHAYTLGLQHLGLLFMLPLL